VDHDGRVTREYLFNCLQLVQPVYGTRGSSGAALSQKAGAGAQATRGGPGAALSQEAGAGALGDTWWPRSCPELGGGSQSHRDVWRPQSCPESVGGHRRRGDTRRPWSCPAFCFDLELVRGGTRSSGYRQWPPGPPRERLRTRGWGQHHFPCSLSKSCMLGFRCDGAAWLIHGDPQITRDTAMFDAEPSHVVIPHVPLLHSRSCGA
jgi:hypothetical protein